jgi:hypothetical protein
MKKVKVQYLRAVHSPIMQKGMVGDVRTLPEGIARNLIRTGYVKKYTAVDAMAKGKKEKKKKKKN